MPIPKGVQCDAQAEGDLLIGHLVPAQNRRGETEAIARRPGGARARPELEPVKPHDLRHTAASVMIAAGINAKALSEYLGHSSIMISFDLYGHLFPGYMDEAAGMLDAYLMRGDHRGVDAAPVASEQDSDVVRATRGPR